MLSIPLPFIAALLFLLIAGLVWLKQGIGVKRIVFFLLLCSATTLVVGLRWSADIQLIRFIQPVLAATLPVTAWYCFELTQDARPFSFKHAITPCLVLLCSLTYPWWTPPIDFILVCLFVFYGVMLIVAARSEPKLVRFFDVQTVTNVRYMAGIMLLFSALIDTGLAVDIALLNGVNTAYILTFTYLLLLPILAITVLMVGSLTSVNEPSSTVDTSMTSGKIELTEANTIVEQLRLFIEKNETYLDPDLTLERLARKLTIPSRQISMAVNQVYQRNVSKVINEYRIKHAQHLLITTEQSITDIYLQSGFYTKSNFNREFSRVTSTTPSAYRRDHS